MKNVIRCTLVALMLTSLAAAAQDLDAGDEQNNAGDYATLLPEYLGLAEQGNSTAQFNLGVMSQHGEGVPKDYGEANRW